MLLLVCTFGATANAQSYTVYEGNPSNTYITYFRDIIGGLSFKDDYVCFRSDQYQYVMVTGDLNYSNGNFSLNNTGKVYTFESNNNYNSYYSYNVSTIDSLSLNASDKIIYSNLGDFLHLEERGARYEIIQTLLMCIVCVCFIIRCIFYKR